MKKSMLFGLVSAIACISVGSAQNGDGAHIMVSKRAYLDKLGLIDDLIDRESAKTIATTIIRARTDPRNFVLKTEEISVKDDGEYWAVDVPNETQFDVERFPLAIAKAQVKIRKHDCTITDLEFILRKPLSHAERE